MTIIPDITVFGGSLFKIRAATLSFRQNLTILNIRIKATRKETIRLVSYYFLKKEKKSRICGYVSRKKNCHFVLLYLFRMRVSGEDAAMLAARKKLPAWNMRDQIRNVIRENKVTILK